jgi:hypothetical protein
MKVPTRQLPSCEGRFKVSIAVFDFDVCGEPGSYAVCFAAISSDRHGPTLLRAEMTKRRIDKEKHERADRVSRAMLDAERQARDEKTIRLRTQRMLVEAARLRGPAAH